MRPQTQEDAHQSHNRPPKSGENEIRTPKPTQENERETQGRAPPAATPNARSLAHQMGLETHLGGGRRGGAFA